MTAAATRRILESYPELSGVIAKVGALKRLQPTSLLVAEAVGRIVIGQMLSGQAARTIYDRTQTEIRKRDLEGIWKLDPRVLRRCGLSDRKSQAIRRFGKYYDANRSEVEGWRSLNQTELFERVREHWGLSDWSAAILGLFHFGNEDIFPETDGSIRRALLRMNASGIDIDPLQFSASEASPYRSYVALYLWRALDQDHI